MSKIRLLCVQGSGQRDGKLAKLMAVAASAAKEAGAQVEHFDLSETSLPVMKVDCQVQAKLPEVMACREKARWAQAFLLGTPEYHGSMSGALKNWFDFLYPELAGCLAGVLCTTWGGNGDLPITAVKTSFAWCHGFTLPFHAAARASDYNESGQLVGEKVIDRAQRIGLDLVRYTPVLQEAFLAAQRHPDPKARGFAGHHPLPEV